MIGDFGTAVFYQLRVHSVLMGLCGRQGETEKTAFVPHCESDTHFRWIPVDQGCQSRGPRAKSGPPSYLAPRQSSTFN